MTLTTIFYLDFLTVISRIITITSYACRYLTVTLFISNNGKSCFIHWPINHISRCLNVKKLKRSFDKFGELKLFELLDKWSVLALSSVCIHMIAVATVCVMRVATIVRYRKHPS